MAYDPSGDRPCENCMSSGGIGRGAATHKAETYSNSAENVAMRFVSYALLTSCTLVAVGMTFAHQSSVRPGPRSIAEVVAAAEKHGFVCTTETSGDRTSNRVVISYKPLDEDEAATVNISSPRAGVASCYFAWGCARVHNEPANSAFWGDMFLYGDPDIVAAMTGGKSGVQ